MKFTKMQGIGNDYVYINCFEETVKDPSAVARFVSDRHFGIGSDGLILIRPSQVADCEMDMYNLDGSQGAMCGNGIRCVAKYVFDHGIVNKTSISIATKSGIKYVDLTVKDGKASLIRVNMGSPILQATQIPVVADTEQVIDAPIQVDGQEYHYTAVSMGNPHAIVYVEDTDSLDLAKIGPSFENHVNFPDRINTEFEPYEYHDGDDIVGIDADIAQAICDKLGYELQIEDMEFDSILAAVNSGKADFGAAGMTVTDDRKENVDFTDTYANASQVIIVKK